MKLKACVECGGEAALGGDGPYYGYCLECGEESVAWAYPREAIKAWNEQNRSVRPDQQPSLSAQAGGGMSALPEPV